MRAVLGRGTVGGQMEVPSEASDRGGALAVLASGAADGAGPGVRPGAEESGLELSSELGLESSLELSLHSLHLLPLLSCLPFPPAHCP